MVYQKTILLLLALSSFASAQPKRVGFYKGQSQASKEATVAARAARNAAKAAERAALLATRASTAARRTIVQTKKDAKNCRKGVSLPTRGPPPGDNPCEGKNPGLDDVQCIEDGATQVGGQSGVNVTKGYNGLLDTDVEPITVPYFQAGLCPVNVHWHLGAEHLSVGEYDETGSGPSDIHKRRRLAGKVRKGFQCTLFDKNDKKFTKPYKWQHCDHMEVGQTYEVHWPHSAAGACGTVNQYQTPFLDGVFCRDNVITSTHTQIGVQGQVYTVVNDEAYYYPDLIRGMIVDGKYGNDIAYYTGSTTGTKRNNTICSQYTPITWQVDRKCHLISASSFDKLCADMKAQRDDMSSDLYPHGSRVLVADELASDNHQHPGSRR